MATNQPNISKVRLCRLFGIARSRYYLAKKPKLPSLAQINLRLWVRQAYEQSKGSAGARSIAHMVSGKYGIKLTRHKAGKLMILQGLVSRQLIKHRYHQTDKDHSIHGNSLNRDFSPTAPNQVWTVI